MTGIQDSLGHKAEGQGPGKDQAHRNCPLRTQKFKAEKDTEVLQPPKGHQSPVLPTTRPRLQGNRITGSNQGRGPCRLHVPMSPPLPTLVKPEWLPQQASVGET